MSKCVRCGGVLYFDPKRKSNVCESCGAADPVKYNYVFNKKDFAKAQQMESDPLAKELQTVKCKSCGANILVNKQEMVSKCMYCGSETISASSKKTMMYIDSIVPFTFGKADAVNKFKRAVATRFYANKKVFKGVSSQDVTGLYINTFVFDFNTNSHYNGTLSYQKSVKDSDGNTHYETVTKNVSGSLDKLFKNLTIEANPNLNQRELLQIMPFEYTSAVDFQQDFINGYVIEYQDKLFNDCVANAERVVKRELEREILNRYGCDTIVSLDIDTEYLDRKYNYCLLPVYMFNKEYKGQRYKALMNGQSGKVGELPTDKLRVFLTILFAAVIVVGIIFLVIFLSK